MENAKTNFMTYNGNHLFHYTKFDSALKIISSRKLLFGDFRNMNDIAESQKEILGDEKTNKELNKYRAISLTYDDRHPRGFEIDSLWGHYADKGNGACLVFDKSKLLTAFDSLQDFHKNSEIEYVDGSNKAVFLESTEERAIAEEIERKYREIFFAKSDDWSIEHEYRLLIRKSDERERDLYFGDALMAVIICMPLYKKIETTCEYDILKHLTKVPILHYDTKLGNKTLKDIEIKSGDELWPLKDVDYKYSD